MAALTTWAAVVLLCLLLMLCSSNAADADDREKPVITGPAKILAFFWYTWECSLETKDRNARPVWSFANGTEFTKTQYTSTMPSRLTLFLTECPDTIGLKCEVTRSDMEIVSAVHTIIIKSSCMSSPRSWTYTELYEGTTVDFYCVFEVPPSQSNVTLQWFFEDTKLPTRVLTTTPTDFGYRLNSITSFKIQRSQSGKEISCNVSLNHDQYNAERSVRVSITPTPEPVRTKYYKFFLLMDHVFNGEVFQLPQGNKSRLYGECHWLPGVLKMALLLKGQYLQALDSSHRKHCIGKLSICPLGYFMSMWLKFPGDSYTQQEVFVSNGGHSSQNHGVAILYGNNELVVIFKMPNGKTWRVSSTGVRIQTWYHVAANWKEDQGLFLYIDGSIKGRDQNPTMGPSATESQTNEFSDFIIGRANDIKFADSLVPMMVDEFKIFEKFRDETEIRTEAILHFYLSLETVPKSTKSDTPAPYGFHVNGVIKPVLGMVGGAISLSGLGEYLAMGSTRGTCLGDLDLCLYGLYIHMWLQLKQQVSEKKAILSSPVFGLYQEGTSIISVIRNRAEYWETRSEGLARDRWYYVELSWQPDLGMWLYVDGLRVSYQTNTKDKLTEYFDTDMYMGRDEIWDITSSAPVYVDELGIYTASRHTLIYINYIRRDVIDNLIWKLSMDEIKNQTVINLPGLDIWIQGNPLLVPGVKGQAVLLDCKTQWITVTQTDHSSQCLGDLQQCKFGYFMAMWLQFRDVRGQQPGVYLSSGGHSTFGHGVAILYREGELQVIFKTAIGRTWTVTTNSVVNGRWYYIAVSWIESDSLFLYINGELEAQTKKYIQGQAAAKNWNYNTFVIGRANDNTNTNQLGYLIVEEFMFMASFQKQTEIIQRGTVRHFSISLNDFRQQTIMWTSTTVTAQAFGAVSEVQGKIGQALYLGEGNAYLDLGSTSGTCLADLDLCQYGLYVSVWLYIKEKSTEQKAIIGSLTFGLYQYGALLTSIVRGHGKTWEVRSGIMATDRWIFVEVTWGPVNGIELYVNFHKEESQPIPKITKSISSTVASNMYLCKDVVLGLTCSPVTVDELYIIFADLNITKRINFTYEELQPTTVPPDRPQGNNYSEMNTYNYSEIIITMEERIDEGLCLEPGWDGISVSGGVHMMTGVLRMALILSGNRQQYLIVLGADHRLQCIGDLSQCKEGYFMSMWLKFPGDNYLKQGVYVSNGGHSSQNHGVAILYGNNELVVIFKMPNGKTWQVSSAGIGIQTWYHVAANWKEDQGLFLYIDGSIKGRDQDPTMGPSATESHTNTFSDFIIGRANDDTSTAMLGPVVVDEFRFQAYFRSEAEVKTEAILHFYLPMDTLSKAAQQDTSAPYRTSVEGGEIQLVTGYKGSAYRLAGNNEYMNMGPANGTCLGDLRLCHYGLYVNLWLYLTVAVPQRRAIITCPTFGLYQEGTSILSLIRTRAEYWEASIQGLIMDRWYYVELTWKAEQGVCMTVNGWMQYCQFNTVKNNLQSSDSNMYMGRDQVLSLSAAPVSVDEMNIYTADHQTINNIRVCNP